MKSKNVQQIWEERGLQKWRLRWSSFNNTTIRAGSQMKGILGFEKEKSGG